MVVEVQRAPDNRWSRPVYPAGLRARKRCPVILLVICLSSKVGEWCAQPIDLGVLTTEVGDSDTGWMILKW